MNKKNTEIVILGGGYAGIMAAVRLAGRTRRLKNISITLVNGLRDFVERPLLHQRATGHSKEQKSIEQMLRGTKVEFQQGWVTALDPSQKKVRIEHQGKLTDLSYDTLIYALGSKVNRRVIPGVDDYAYTLDSFGRNCTADLRERLREPSKQTGSIIVIGGGATGIEAAAEIKSRFPEWKMTLISEGKIGAFKGENVRVQIYEALHGQQINMMEGQRVQAVGPDWVQLEGEKLAMDIVVWAGGFAAPTLAAKAGVQTNERRQILVDPFLRSLSHPDIFAVGDSAMTVEEPGAPMRMCLFIAIVSGAQAADNLAALLKGKNPRPLSYAWYGQGIALGQDDAVGFLTYPADAVSGPILRGKLAVNVRNFFVWLLGASLEIERRFPGVLFWNGRGRYAKAMKSQQSKQTGVTQQTKTVIN